MSSSKKNDWDVVKEITYAVVEEIKGRGTSFDDTLAKTLGVSGVYMVMYFPNSEIDFKLYFCVSYSANDFISITLWFLGLVT